MQNRDDTFSGIAQAWNRALKVSFDSVAFAKRLELLRGSQSERAFAKKLGITATSYSNYIRGQVPGVDKVVAIAAACQVSIDWLLEGASVAVDAGRINEQIVPEFAEVAEGNSIDPRAVMLRVAADNMDPTLRLGDTIFIDCSDKRLTDCSIYAFSMGAGIGLRRIVRQLPGTILLVSDNVRYPPEAYDAVLIEEGTVFGRVVSYGRLI